MEVATAGDVEVRTAQVRDLDSIVSLTLACQRTRIGWAGTDWSPSALVAERQIWWDRLADAHTWVSVASAGPAWVGAVALTRAAAESERGPEVAYVAGPLVDPEWWGNGIGSLLMSEAGMVAAGLGYARAELLVELGNGRARGFLEHQGWERQDLGPRPSPMTLVLYSREIGPAGARRHAA